MDVEKDSGRGWWTENELLLLDTAFPGPNLAMLGSFIIPVFGPRLCPGIKTDSIQA